MHTMLTDRDRTRDRSTTLMNDASALGPKIDMRGYVSLPEKLRGFLLQGEKNTRKTTVTQFPRVSFAAPEVILWRS